jgi:hypothetical protein
MLPIESSELAHRLCLPWLGVHHQHDLTSSEGGGVRCACHRHGAEGKAAAGGRMPFRGRVRSVSLGVDRGCHSPASASGVTTVIGPTINSPPGPTLPDPIETYPTPLWDPPSNARPASRSGPCWEPSPSPTIADGPAQCLPPVALAARAQVFIHPLRLMAATSCARHVGRENAVFATWLRPYFYVLEARLQVTRRFGAPIPLAPRQDDGVPDDPPSPPKVDARKAGCAEVR